MEIKYYVNKWLSSDIIYWKDEFQEINNLLCIKEEDRDFVKNNIKIAFGKCIGTEGGGLILFNCNFTIHIKPQLVKKIFPTPKFEWGNEIQEVIRPQIKGVIEKIEWHYKNQMYVYYINIDGKMKSRRYNGDELEKTR